MGPVISKLKKKKESTSNESDQQAAKEVRTEQPIEEKLPEEKPEEKPSEEKSSEEKSEEKNSEEPHTEQTPVKKSEDRSNYPLIISGPSGVGKGTLMDRLFKDFPTTFVKKISHTTRAPRAGEVNGVNYHFISVEEFEADVKAGKFMEHVLTHGRRYGTQFSSVTSLLGQNKIVLLEVDVIGIQLINVRNAAITSGSSTDSVFRYNSVWIAPPDYDALIERLRGRGSETDETIKTRMETAQKERQLVESDIEKQLFHDTIINDDLEKCYTDLKRHIANLYPAYESILFPQQEEPIPELSNCPPVNAPAPPTIQLIEETKIEESKVEEETKIEEPKVEEPKIEEPKTEEPKVEEPKDEELKVEEFKVEEPKIEELNVEGPKVEELNVAEHNVEEPKVEEPKVEEPKVEEPKVEEPDVEEPKVEEPDVEEPKVEEL